ncbi:MAG: DUF3995 domain-containing protein [Coriobacteriales bacterium]|jgi:hypothetical protein|nr:DUF3995 domain-containing protein [Coriobacteriales bacterium]
MYVMGVLGSVMFFVIAGFHVYWFLGGTVGTDRYIGLGRDGERIRIPRPLILAAALVFFVAALLPLVALGILDIPIPKQLVDAALIAGIFILALRGAGGFAWSLVQPKPRDIFHTWNISLYTGICLILALSYGACLVP